MMKKLSFLLLSSVILFSACKKDSSDPAPTPSKARVMFGHTTIGVDSLKLQLNNATLTSVPGLGFGTYTNYVEVDPGSTKVSFNLLNAGTIVLDSTTTNFATNGYYSVFTTGVVTSPNIVITTDDLSAPPAGSAKVRFINLSPENLNESLYIGPTKLDSNISFGKATQFHTIAAGTQVVLVQDPSPTKAYLVRSASQAFAVGKIYTVVLYGTEAAAGPSQLNIKVLTNN